MLFSSSMRGSIILASMYIGGAYYAVWYPEAIVFFPVFWFSSRLRTGLPWIFCWKLPPSSFLRGVLVRCPRRWLVIFPCIVFFFYICRVCSSIYKICISWVDYFYWWNLHDSRFVDGRLLWRFLFPLAALSLEHCFARPFRLPAQVELTCRMSTIVTGLDSTRFPLHRKR